MRLIDANALMKYCNNLKDKTIDANDIARFPTAYGWISVNDGLPKEDVFECLVVDHGETSFAYHMIRDGKHDFYMDYGDEIDEFDAVTHWMPLPEPPKEDE